MKVLPLPVLAALLACVWSTLFARGETPAQLVKAQLIADAKAVKPGGTVTLGVLLDVEPHWHVYWINPGDSGRPTTVKFQAPAGVTVGELRYPVPIRFKQPGDMVGYGYEEKVLHTAEARVPADAKAGTDITISADVAWLVCKDVCIPGKAKLSITLPVSQEPVAMANEKVFAEWADRWPLEKLDAMKGSSWSAADGGTFTVDVEWAKPPKQVELYPGRLPAVAVEGIDVKTEGNKTRATVTARVRPGQKLEADAMPSLLVYTGDDGVRRGINIEIPVGALRSAGGNDTGTPAKTGG